MVFRPTRASSTGSMFSPIFSIRTQSPFATARSMVSRYLKKTNIQYNLSQLTPCYYDLFFSFLTWKLRLSQELPHPANSNQFECVGQVTGTKFWSPRTRLTSCSEAMFCCFDFKTVSSVFRRQKWISNSRQVSDASLQPTQLEH